MTDDLEKQPESGGLDYGIVSSLFPSTAPLPAATEDDIDAAYEWIFEELYEYHREPLARRVQVLTGDYELTLDICDEAFLRLWKNYFAALVRTPDYRTQFPSLLYTIAINCFYDHARRQRLITFESLPNSEPDDPSAYRIFAQASVPGHEDQACDRHLIEQVLAKMSPKYRNYLILRRWYGFSYQEIAEKEHTTIDAVSSGVSHGMRQFRDIYRKMVGARYAGHRKGKPNGRTNV